MYTADFIIYSILTLIIFIEIFVFIYFIEYLICVCIHHQPPFVSTEKSTQKAIIQEIKKHYPQATKICEIGSGYGQMARFIGRKTGAKVIALENMPISVLISKTLDLFQTNSKTIKCDAFEFLDTTKQKFDIGIAYLSPKYSDKLLKYKNKFKVLITIDFAISKLPPTKTINSGHGNTIFNGKKYPHKLFIYEFK